MNFKNLDIKVTYDSGTDNITKDFYEPVLAYTKDYYRIAGFFTSSSLYISGRGLLQMYKNGGHMKLLVSPRLNYDDVKILNDVYENPDKYLGEVLNRELLLDKNSLTNDYTKLMAYFVVNGFIEIKIVVIKDNQEKLMTYDDVNKSSLFHQKIGILRDYEGNLISFSGSVNETFSAWTNNIEEFKTFKDWEFGQKEYLSSDFEKFKNYWFNKIDKTEVLPFPKATELKLIEITKEENIESVITRIKKQSKNTNEEEINLSLFSYQKEALNLWINNDYNLMFAMATGTGKTRTAIACMYHLLKKDKQLVTVIATPESTLTNQWKKEIENFNINFDYVLTADSSNGKYKDQLKKYIFNLNHGIKNNLIIYTTHDSYYKEDFINQILKLNTTNILLIGDEVHGMGSNFLKQGLLSKYKYRIGLSATPSRWFDEEGSINLINYFGNKQYEFSINDALNTINPLTGKAFLVEYNYYVKKVYLSDDDNNNYSKFTKEITKLNFIKDKDSKTISLIDSLIRNRSDIVKSCENKIPALKELLINIKDLENTLIFVSPTLFNDVIQLLRDLDIPFAPYTGNQKRNQESKYNGLSEREYILQKFKSGYYKVLVAMKCLDEGIDIPIADTAILVSSTTNPREYIQRIGRVIRQSPNKERAYIYDLIVRSNDAEINQTIMAKEYKRNKYIMESAINSIDAINEVYN